MVAVVIYETISDLLNPVWRATALGNIEEKVVKPRCCNIVESSKTYNMFTIMKQQCFQNTKTEENPVHKRHNMVSKKISMVKLLHFYE